MLLIVGAPFRPQGDLARNCLQRSGRNIDRGLPQGLRHLRESEIVLQQRGLIDLDRNLVRTRPLKLRIGDLGEIHDIISHLHPELSHVMLAEITTDDDTDDPSIGLCGSDHHILRVAGGEILKRIDPRFDQILNLPHVIVLIDLNGDITTARVRGGKHIFDALNVGDRLFDADHNGLFDLFRSGSAVIHRDRNGATLKFRKDLQRDFL